MKNISTRPRSNKTHVPKIACFNKAKTPLGVDLDLLISAMQKYVDECVAPVWGTPARLIKSRGFVKGAWAMVFLDGARVKDAQGYHDVTRTAYPWLRSSSSLFSLPATR